MKTPKPRLRSRTVHLSHWDREASTVEAACGSRSGAVSPVLAEVTCAGCRSCYRNVMLAASYRRRAGLPPIVYAV